MRPMTKRKFGTNSVKHEDSFDDIQARNNSSPIRLVDIHDLCVRSFKHCNLDKQYIALSYVWGCVQGMKLMNENMGDLERPGALATNDLQQTVRDAIEVAAMLGFSYLWVEMRYA